MHRQIGLEETSEWGINYESLRLQICLVYRKENEERFIDILNRNKITQLGYI